MKKSMSLLCVLTMWLGVMCVGGVGVASAATEGDFKYEVSDGKATITDYLGSAETLEIPSMLGGYPVAVLSVNAFYQATFKHVVIPEGVVKISDLAFSYCSNLQSVVIPDSVTAITDWAFTDCTALSDITIGDGITEIGIGTLQETAYYHDESHWENGILYLDDYVVDAVYPLSGHVVLRPGTRVIANQCFAGREITEITIPDSMKAIGWIAFAGVTPETVYYGGSEEQWQSIAIDSGNTSLQNATIYYNWGADEPEMPTLGDLNGDDELDMRDAFALYSAASGGAELTEEQLAVADMNGDGEIDMRDAFVLYQTVSGG